MKSVYGLTTAAAVAFAGLIMTTQSGVAATQRIMNQPGEKYCLVYKGGAGDCSFRTLQECRASMSGIGAECLVNVFHRDDSDI